MTEKKKLIDEKGKLFGKINIIDLIVLVLILAVVVVVGIKLLGRGPAVPGQTVGAGTELEYTVLVYRVADNVYASVEKEMALGGDHTTLMATGEMLTGSYVVSATPAPHFESVRRADGTIAISEEPGYVDITFTIRATVPNPITQSVGTQEVRIGRGHIVKTKTFELGNGIVLTCAPVTPG